MKNNAKKLRFIYLKASACEVYRQLKQHPTLGIPVNPDVAVWMGAFREPAIHELDAIRGHDGKQYDAAAADIAGTGDGAGEASNKHIAHVNDNEDFAFNTNAAAGLTPAAA